MVREQGGVAIAAHATGSKGLLRALQGKARIKAWSNPDLLAVQIPGSLEDLPQAERSILHNRNPRPEPWSSRREQWSKGLQAIVNSQET